MASCHAGAAIRDAGSGARPLRIPAERADGDGEPHDAPGGEDGHVGAVEAAAGRGGGEAALQPLGEVREREHPPDVPEPVGEVVGRDEHARDEPEDHRRERADGRRRVGGGGDA